MSTRDDFSNPTKRTLAERASLRCSNPNCGHVTSGPSDDYASVSTLLGKAAHITAASRGGPRYDASLTPEQRSSPENGIWLCAECADRVDKKENEKKYPVELLRHWKVFHESVAGTDFASKENRKKYPVSRLVIENFAGVNGRVDIRFSAFTLFVGTSKLSRNIGDLLWLFSDRESFSATRQPRTTSTIDMKTLPVNEELAFRVTVTLPEPRIFSRTGKLKVALSDGSEFVIRASNSNVEFFQGDAKLPVFAPVVKVVRIAKRLYKKTFQDQKSQLAGVSSYFGLSSNELAAIFEGVPTDQFLYGYEYDLKENGDIYVRLPGRPTFISLAAISDGELNRFVLDMAVKIATYSSKIRPTVLAIDHSSTISLDQKGWAHFLEWIESAQPSFQVVIDLAYRPSEGSLKYALCYEAVGDDMAVKTFVLQTWQEFCAPFG